MGGVFSSESTEYATKGNIEAVKKNVSVIKHNVNNIKKHNSGSVNGNNGNYKSIHHNNNNNGNNINNNGSGDPTAHNNNSKAPLLTKNEQAASRRNNAAEVTKSAELLTQEKPALTAAPSAPPAAPAAPANSGAPPKEKPISFTIRNLNRNLNDYLKAKNQAAANAVLNRPSITNKGAFMKKVRNAQAKAATLHKLATPPGNVTRTARQQNLNAFEAFGDPSKAPLPPRATARAAIPKFSSSAVRGTNLERANAENARAPNNFNAFLETVKPKEGEPNVFASAAPAASAPASPAAPAPAAPSAAPAATAPAATAPAAPASSAPAAPASSAPAGNAKSVNKIASAFSNNFVQTALAETQAQGGEAAAAVKEVKKQINVLQQKPPEEKGISLNEARRLSAAVAAVKEAAPVEKKGVLENLYNSFKSFIPNLEGGSRKRRAHTRSRRNRRNTKKNRK